MGVRQHYIKAVVLGLTALILQGCSDAAPQVPESQTAITESKEKEASNEETETAVAVFTDDGIQTDGDGITADGTVLTISEEGTYVLRGTCEDGQIVVDAGDSGKVRLVFDGLSLTCKSHSPVYIKQADKVEITLKEESENTLEDSEEYELDEEDGNVDGVIFSKADLTINGSGALHITALYKHGIVSKDNLEVADGNLTIDASYDAIHTNGDMIINGGTMTLSTGDDALHADGSVTIEDGTLNILKSYEGIEGNTVKINGGTIDLTASDDGINAAGSGEIYVEINGGTIYVNASGDGIDANGSIYINGGSVYVSGASDRSNGALDYDREAEITGGTIIAAGSSGMVQGFFDTSSQYSIVYQFDSETAGGQPVEILDETGTVLASYTPHKTWQTVVISTPQLELGKVYTVKAGEQSGEIEITAMTNGNQVSGSFGNRREDGGQRRPDKGKPESGGVLEQPK